MKSDPHRPRDESAALDPAAGSKLSVDNSVPNSLSSKEVATEISESSERPEMERPRGRRGSENGDGKSKRELWKKLISWVIVLVVAIFLVVTVRKAITEIQSRGGEFQLQNLDWRYLAAGVSLYALGLFPGALGWMGVLKDFRQNLPIARTLHAYFLGHLGKYVPGKAMVLVLRVGKLQPHGLSIKAGIVSVFVETITSVCAGGILGALLILFLDVPFWLKISAGCCLPLAIALLTPHFFKLGLGMVAASKVGKMPKSIPAAFTSWFMVRTTSWMLLGWLLQGTAAWLVMLSMSQAPGISSFYGWASTTSAVCLGGVAGFASMLPGGAVVREIVITWLLAPLVTQPIALLAAIVFRIGNLAAECLVNVVTAGLDRSSKVPVKERRAQRD